MERLFQSHYKWKNRNVVNVRATIREASESGGFLNRVHRGVSAQTIDMFIQEINDNYGGMLQKKLEFDKFYILYD